jgi:hypothetical protein
MLAYVAFSASGVSNVVMADSNSQIPFDGMSLAYYSETTPTLQAETGVSATGWATFTFNSVTATSSVMGVAVNGTVTSKDGQQPVNFTLAVSFPTNEDTLLYLRHGGQQNLLIYAAPADQSFQLVPGYNFNLTRTWDYLGQSTVTTTFGSFPTYRYHTSQTLGDAVLDFYAYYDINSQVLVYGEVFATKSGFNVQIEKITLRQENFQTPTGAATSPQCVIATAAYGSELAPPVQFLREFRDKNVKETYLGNRFVSAFNAWYYSWAPPVAQAESGNSYMRATVRAAIMPLLGALFVSASIFSWVRPVSPEMDVLISGMVASALIGLTYLTPVAFVVVRATKRKLTWKSVLCVASFGVALTLLGTVAHGSVGIVENLTALTVIETMLLTPTTLLQRIWVMKPQSHLL